MNALLRIQVEVAAREAQATLRTLTSSIQAVNRAAVSMGRSGGGSVLGAGAKSVSGELTALGRLSQSINGSLDRTGQGMIQMGKNMQWVGRQINYNFTLPLLLAGRAAFKWALDYETAFNRIKQVYGTFGTDYTAELGKIGTALRLLSDYYGVNITAVTDLAAQWAEAGLTGAALATAVKTSLDVSVLGNYSDLKDIFTQLITVQAAYKLNADQVRVAVSELNTAQKMTAATLPDLITGIAKAGSSAELAGVDFHHLAAFMTVLTPATGSAANAGNALKTIFSRLAKPTADTVKGLHDLGIEVDSSSFQMLNGSQKLELMATKFAGLTDAQKAFVASAIGARFQVNKFAEIMNSISDKSGNYQKVLEAITGKGADATNLKNANDQIQIMLKSDPQRIKILTNEIKNLVMDAITPLIPVIAIVLGYIQALFTWFGHLSPAVQKLTFGIMLLVIAVGVSAQILGSFKLLIGTFIDFLIFMAQLIPGVGLEAVAASGAAVAAAEVDAGLIVAASETALAAEAAAVTATAAATAAAAALAAAGVSGSMADITTAVNLGAVANIAAMQATAAAAVAADAEIAAAAVATEAAISVGMVAAIVLAAAAVVALIVIFRKQIGDAIVDVISVIGHAFAALPGIIGRALMAVFNTVVKIVQAIVKWLSYLSPFSKHSPSLVENVTAGVEAILFQYARLSGIGAMFARAANDISTFAAATAAAQEAATATSRSETRRDITATSPSAGPSIDAMFSNMDRLNALLGPLNLAIGKQQAIVDTLKEAYDAASLAVRHYTSSMKEQTELVASLKTQMDTANQAIQDYASSNITGMKAAADATFANEMAQKKLRLEILLLGDAGQGYDDLLKKISALNGDIENIRGTMKDLQLAGAGSDVLGVYQQQLDQLTAQKDALTVSAQNGADLTLQLAALQHQAEIMDLQKSLKFDPLLKQIADLASTTKELPFEQIIAGITGQKDHLDRLTASYNTNKAALDAQQVVLDQMTATRDALQQSYDDENATLQTLKDGYASIEDQIRKITDALNAAVDANKTLTAATKSGGGGGGGGGGVPFADMTGQYDPTKLDDSLTKSTKSIDDWIKEMQKKFGAIKIDPFAFIKNAWHKLDEWTKSWGLSLGNWLEGSGLGKVIFDFLTGHFSDGWTHLKILLGRIWDQIWRWGQDVTDFFNGLGNTITNAFTDAQVWLWNKGGDLMQGLWDGIVWVWDKITGWLGGLWQDFITSISDFFGIHSPSTRMKNIGIDILTGLWNGLVEGAVAVWNFFTELPGKVVGFFGTALNWLLDKGSNILTGLWNGITTGAVAVWNWFTNLPGTLIGYFATAFLWLWDVSTGIASGIWNGIKQGAQDVWTWFINLPGVVLGYFSKAETWLLDVGASIIQGLWNGLKSVWDNVSGWLGGLGSKITSLKGPPERDAKLLQNNGRLIMQGLHQGMMQGWDTTAAWLSQLDPSSLLKNNSALSNFSFGLDSAQTMVGMDAPKSYTFNGDLSFPNITDPADAEKFIQNLEVLAGTKGGL